jgi:hypothetical protein
LIDRWPLDDGHAPLSFETDAKLRGGAAVLALRSPPSPGRGAVTVPEIQHQSGALEPAGSGAIERQLAVERSVFRSILRGVIVALPVAMGVLIGMMALAFSDKEPWYVWVGLGGGLGIYAAGFFGLIFGVTIAAHRLDQVDEPDHPLHS